jgi:hypothetical protein
MNPPQPAALVIAVEIPNPWHAQNLKHTLTPWAHMNSKTWWRLYYEAWTITRLLWLLAEKMTGRIATHWAASPHGSKVKHREQKVNVSEVRELMGLLAKEGDLGRIVSSGGFTPDAEAAIRSSAKHIEKIDLNDLIKKWDEHYDRMKEDRRLMPVKRIAFLAPEEST